MEETEDEDDNAQECNSKSPRQMERPPHECTRRDAFVAVPRLRATRAATIQEHALNENVGSVQAAEPSYPNETQIVLRDGLGLDYQVRLLRALTKSFQHSMPEHQHLDHLREAIACEDGPLLNQPRSRKINKISASAPWTITHSPFLAKGGNALNMERW